PLASCPARWPPCLDRSRRRIHRCYYASFRHAPPGMVDASRPAGGIRDDHDSTHPGGGTGVDNLGDSGHGGPVVPGGGLGPGDAVPRGGRTERARPETGPATTPEAGGAEAGGKKIIGGEEGQKGSTGGAH